MPGQAAKRKRHDLDGADQVSLPSLLFPAPLFLPSIFSIALTCNGHANYTLKQSPKIYIKFTVALPSCWYSTENRQKDVAFFFFVFGRASPEFEKWVNSREAVH